jgi:hypothetical protein
VSEPLFNRRVLHAFHAAAFVENLSLKELAGGYPKGKRTAHELRVELAGGGEMFVYPFGAVVFRDSPPAERDAELARLHQLRGGLTTSAVIKEDFAVCEDASAEPDVSEGVLTLDRTTPARASIIALTVGQSASNWYAQRSAVGSAFARQARRGLGRPGYRSHLRPAASGVRLG